MRLVLGEVESPYSYGDTSRTTGDVGQKLEEKYHLYSSFAEMYQGNIAKLLENSVAGALETVLMGGVAGAPAPRIKFEAATSQIEALFRQSLAIKAYDGILAGVPTQSAIDGVSHRFMNVYNRASFVNKKGKRVKAKRRPSRPSFVDTGNLSRNFVCWVES